MIYININPCKYNNIYQIYNRMQSQLHTPSIEIKHSEIIKLILQYLHEHNLPQSFLTLQQQSHISMNTLNKQQLTTIIDQSNWQQLFKIINNIMPSEQTLFDLLEIVVDQLIQRDCYQAANYVIKNCMKSNSSGNNRVLYEDYKERVLRLEYICQNPAQKPVYMKPVTSQRKQNIIARLIKQTHQEVQPSRLLTLIGQAIKYQSLSNLIVPNISLSLFQNKQHQLIQQSQQLIKTQQKVQKHSEQSRISCVTISNKGEYIALGGIDGLIQIYNSIQYTLHTGLAFQADDVMLYHDDPVTHIVFNETDQLLLSGDIKGNIKVWNTNTGKLLRKLQHGTSIGGVTWGNDPSHILIAYQNIKLYGIRGCNILKQYMCSSITTGPQNQYILNIFSSNLKIYSITHNGTIRVHNYRTQQQINNITLKNAGMIIKALPVYRNNMELSSFFVCTQNKLIQYNTQLLQINKFSLPDQSSKYTNFVCVNNYIYQCIENVLDNGKIKNYKLQVREKKTGKVIYFSNLEEKLDVMELQKFRNLLVTYDEADNLIFWRP